MKVLVAAASFATSVSGVQRHALNLARCMLLRSEVSELHFVLAPWQRNFAQDAGLPPNARLRIHIAPIKRSSLSRNLWYYRRLPRLAAQLEADIVHLSYPMPLNAAAFGCPVVVSLHDLYPYEIPINFGFPKFILNRIVLRQCLRQADAIACVSEATRVRLKQYAPPSVWRKAIRIYNCVEPEPVAAAQAPIPGWRGEPFLLCVAQHRRNKNIPTLIRAFDRLLRCGEIVADAKLVVVGMGGPETGRIRRLVAASGLHGSVHLVEGLAEPELQWCYRQCEALVAPSLTEGFGLPVAEGLLAGCRIICSDIPAHREIGEEHCQFVSLREYAIEALAAAIMDSLCEQKRGPVPLPQLSAPALAGQYMALYRELGASAAPAQCARAGLDPHRNLREPISMKVPENHSALLCGGK
jgi:glycosyltransferase involved in cell wall biosynthesis